MGAVKQKVPDKVFYLTVATYSHYCATIHIVYGELLTLRVLIFEELPESICRLRKLTSQKRPKVVFI